MAKEEKKKADLDKITEDLDPDKINEKVVIPHITAHHKYLPKLENKISVNDYEEFKKEVIAYTKHHHKEVYKTDMPDDIAFARAQQFLEAAFKNKGGFLGAYQQARKGRLGDVIKALADTEAAQHQGSYKEYIMNQIDPLDWDEHVDLVKQYKSKYQSLLPKELKQKSDEQLANNWKDLIDHHLETVTGVKGYTKKYEPKKKKEAA